MAVWRSRKIYILGEKKLSLVLQPIEGKFLLRKSFLVSAFVYANETSYLLVFSYMTVQVHDTPWCETEMPRRLFGLEPHHYNADQWPINKRHHGAWWCFAVTGKQAHIQQSMTLKSTLLHPHLFEASVHYGIGLIYKSWHDRYVSQSTRCASGRCEMHLLHVWDLPFKWLIPVYSIALS